MFITIPTTDLSENQLKDLKEYLKKQNINFKDWKEIEQKIHELQQDQFEYIDNGSYDNCLSDFADNNELKTTNDRRHAFNRFTSKVEYDDYMNCAFADGSLYYLKEFTNFLTK